MTGTGILRAGAALVLIVVLGAYAAPMIRSGGYGGWVVAAVACVVCPFVVALVAGRWHVPFGLLTTGAIVASFVIRDHWIDPAHRGYDLGWKPALCCSLVAFCLSLPGSVGAAAVAHPPTE